MRRAAIGFRVHTGWAAAVSVAGSRRSPAVIDRRRLELTDRSVPRQVYHAARDLDAPEAQELVRRATETAAAIARHAVRELIGELRAAGHEVVGAGIVLASGHPAPTLAQALSSHAAIHTAEGEMYRSALVQASDHQALPITGVPERNLYEGAAAVLKIPVDDLRRRMTELRHRLGSPWGQDQKEAALVAWLALTAAPSARTGARRASRRA